MMMKLYIALLAASLLLLSGCGNKPKPGEDDTLTSGTITIAVDETFRPIIEEELQVFYVKAKQMFTLRILSLASPL